MTEEYTEPTPPEQLPEELPKEAAPPEPIVFSVYRVIKDIKGLVSRGSIISIPNGQETLFRVFVPSPEFNQTVERTDGLRLKDAPELEFIGEYSEEEHRVLMAGGNFDIEPEIEDEPVEDEPYREENLPEFPESDNNKDEEGSEEE